MLIKSKKPWELGESEVTPQNIYRNRRDVLRSMGIGAAAAAATGFLPSGARAAPLDYSKRAYVTEGEELTPYDAVTGYNNFYEFGTGKNDPAEHAHKLTIDPWSVEIKGHVEKPGVISLEDLIHGPELEERIYRMRCVEGWSMVIPWIGIPLHKIIERFGPTSDAKYIAFETAVKRGEMPGVWSRVLRWPYVEGLRMDEAMHPLTMLAVGLYGEDIPKQNGAPIRLVVPWKYGFKSIKSIVAIHFVEREPSTSWNIQNAREFGFYSNVNPSAPHPRWSQATERRIGEFRRRETLMFNGYGDAVASLYSGMDLIAHF